MYLPERLMSRKARLFTAAGLLLAATPAHADWLDWFRDGFHKNHQWPEPFVYQDREAVIAPFEAMVHNGWKQQTMICGYHFQPDSAKLTPSGRAKLSWILRQAPPEHRTVYVQETESRKLTLARIDAVQQLAARQIPPGQLPAVVATTTPADGTSADDVDAVMRGFSKSAPAPRLPASTSSASGGSSEGK
jgi:hypothetical protein